MSNPVDSVTTLVVKRFIKAPRERVFAAWTTPDDLLKWFGPKSCRALAAEVDLRVDGRYHVQIESQVMGSVGLSGVYREIQSPSRLVFTWQWQNPPMQDFGESLVTVNFYEAEGGTDVHLIHERFPNAQVRDNHGYGWSGCLDKLDVLFGGEDEPPVVPLGSFCWNELLVRDTAAQGAFYNRLLGWEAVATPMGEMNYTIFKAGGRDVAGMMPVPMPGVPPHWLTYVKVADVDASARLAGELGGKVVAGPFDIPNIGRIAVVLDPEGAAFGLYQRTEA
jgi:hypothetical protein